MKFIEVLLNDDIYIYHVERFSYVHVDRVEGSIAIMGLNGIMDLKIHLKDKNSIRDGKGALRFTGFMSSDLSEEFDSVFILEAEIIEQYPIGGFSG